MTDVIEIKGGATEFEAAVIAVVLDQVESDQRRPSRPGDGLPPWVRAAGNHANYSPLESLRPV